MSKSSARKSPAKTAKTSAKRAEPISIPRTHKSAPLKQLALTDDKPSNGLWPSDGVVFDRTCTDCPRLAAFLEEGRKQYPDYYCAPVAPFGDRKAHLIIIGLAPGFHGANATGRPFTGDYAGVLLYQTLYKFGFANKPESIHRNDGLKLINARISNAVKCVPPDNKPLPVEITTCNHYLQAELAVAPKNVVLLALGSIGHNAVLRTLGLKAGSYKFGHGAEFKLPGGQWLIDSYHCSRYNTNTRRLTEEMFEAVFARAKALIESAPGNT
nr:uracil-DNA glycosylase [Steroidobacter cummioxidans]